MEKKRDLLLDISQLFGIGRVNTAPGTVASLVTCLISYPFIILSIWWKIIILIILTVVGSISGFHAEGVLETKDPSSVVIDEVVGQLVVFCFISEPKLLSITVGFFLFRVLDILKPPPIKSFEKIPSGWGIMADDIIAGFIGGLILFLFLKIIG